MGKNWKKLARKNWKIEKKKKTGKIYQEKVGKL